MKIRCIAYPAAILAVAATGVLALGGEPATFRRYVSPPLPDGVRFTFLYPTRLRLAAEEPGVARLQRFRPRTLQALLSEALPTGDSRVEPYEELEATLLPYQSLYPAGRTEWVEEGPALECAHGPHGPRQTHQLYLNDPRSRRTYVLTHSWALSEQRGADDVDRRVFAGFRLLQPGEQP